ncbi:MAG: hypothetical protein ABUL49_00395 [bacterium]
MANDKATEKKPQPRRQAPTPELETVVERLMDRIEKLEQMIASNLAAPDPSEEGEAQKAPRKKTSSRKSTVSQDPDSLEALSQFHIEGGSHEPAREDEPSTNAHHLIADWQGEPSARNAPISEDEIATMFAGAEDFTNEEAQAIEPAETNFGILTSADIEQSLRPTGEKYEISMASRLTKDELGENGDGGMSDDDIANLFAQADQLSAPSHQTLSAEDIAGILAEPSDDGFTSKTPDSAVMMSEDEIAALMKAAAAEQSSGFSLEGLTNDLPPSSAEPKATTAPKPKPQLRLEKSSGVEVNKELASLVPMELAIAALAFPVSVEPGKLVCHVAEPFDHEALADLSRAVGLLIETNAASADTVVGGLRELYQDQDQVRFERAVVKAGSASRTIVEWAIELYRRVA